MPQDVINALLGFVIGYLLGWGQGKIEKEEVKRMATLDKDQPSGEIQVCDWCRMGLHLKCERHKLHTICVCDCERGY
jgi:hypothetical protein